MMDDPVEKVISQLKSRFEAHSDLELAEKLHLGRSTVTSWRRRGHVPARYAELATETFAPSYMLPFPTWTPVEKLVIRLALLRMIRDLRGYVTDYMTYLSEGRQLDGKLLEYTHQALIDVDSEMKARGISDVAQCVQMMVFQEFFAPR